MQFSFSIISQLVVIIYLDIILLLILFISHFSLLIPHLEFHSSSDEGNSMR